MKIPAGASWVVIAVLVAEAISSPGVALLLVAVGAAVFGIAFWIWEVRSGGS